MKRTLAMLLALALLLLCACSAAPEPTQPAAEPPVETAETLPDHAAQDDAASEPAQPLFWQVSGNGYSGSFTCSAPSTSATASPIRRSFWTPMPPATRWPWRATFSRWRQTCRRRSK